MHHVLARLHHLLFTLKMCTRTTRLKLDTDVYMSLFRQGIHLRWDNKRACIKSSRKKSDSLQGNIKGLQMSLWAISWASIEKCWVGTCSRSPIQWNWFHPATPRSWDLLIPQVWNCSERSEETKGERAAERRMERWSWSCVWHLLHTPAEINTPPQMKTWVCPFFKKKQKQKKNTLCNSESFILHATFILAGKKKRYLMFCSHL